MRWRTISAVALATMAFSVQCLAVSVLDKGRALYLTNCATCHGDQGDGNGPAGAYLNPKPRDFTKDKFKYGSSLDQIVKTISNGIPSASMPSFSNLAAGDRQAIAQYVLSLRTKKTKK